MVKVWFLCLFIVILWQDVTAKCKQTELAIDEQGRNLEGAQTVEKLKSNIMCCYQKMQKALEVHFSSLTRGINIRFHPVDVGCRLEALLNDVEHRPTRTYTQGRAQHFRHCSIFPPLADLSSLFRLPLLNES